jgi:hypothetical protein
LLALNVKAVQCSLQGLKVFTHNVIKYYYLHSLHYSEEQNVLSWRIGFI